MTRAERYLSKFDEVNFLAGVIWRFTDGQSVERRVQQISDEFFEFLVDAYLLGLQDAGAMLGVGPYIDTVRMNRVIYKVIAGETFENRIQTHVENEDLPMLRVLAESEFHRVYNSALMDEAESFANNTGISVYKRWNTQMDNRVRATHWYIEGVDKPLNERFYTFDGDSALQPGDFELPENNVNCRCWLTFSTGNGGREIALENSQAETTD